MSAHARLTGLTGLTGVMILGAACATTGSAPATSPVAPFGSVASAASTAATAVLTFREVPLPGVSGAASLDYIAYEPTQGRVWVPVGNTGSVDVFDPKTSVFTRVDGFATAERDVRGAKRTIGPSAAYPGVGFVYVGNRATSEVCAVDTTSLKLRKCVKLAASTDGVAFLASAKEVWVTTPSAKTIAVLDVAQPDAPKVKTEIALEGEPEGYAVDERRGLFYTNLEDKGGTVVLDVRTHKVKATWQAGCGEDGPRGLALDAARNFLFVACTDHVQVVDAGHDGALLGKLATGKGVDNIDWLDARGLLYAAAGKDARLTIGHVNDRGDVSVVATGTTAPGARNPVADAEGNAYVADGHGARLLIFPYPK